MRPTHVMTVMFIMATLATIVIAPLLAAQVFAQSAPMPRPEVEAPEGFRANRTTYSTIMDVLAPTRVRVTDAHLERLEALQLESLWIALGDYRGNYASGFRSTQPGRLVGRAVTMRFLPPRPDVVRALDVLAAEGDWDRRYYARAAEEAGPGDVVVVDLGGTDGNQLFGDMGALGIKLTGANGVIIDGGTRDLAELQGEAFAGFPVFARFFDIQVSRWFGVDYNAPIKVGNAIVLPGDVVVADEGGVIFFPPEIIDEVLEAAERNVALEDHERELLIEGQHRFRDVYPLSPALREEWERSRQRP